MKNKIISIENILIIFEKLALIEKTLILNDIWYGDLKPSNILLRRDDSNYTSYNLY